MGITMLGGQEFSRDVAAATQIAKQGAVVIVEDKKPAFVFLRYVDWYPWSNGGSEIKDDIVAVRRRRICSTNICRSISPPCFWTSSAFAPTPTKTLHRHPFPQYRNELEIEGELPPNAIYTWPFRLSITHASYKQHGQYFPDLEERIDRYIARLGPDEDLAEAVFGLLAEGNKCPEHLVRWKGVLRDARVGWRDHKARPHFCVNSHFSASRSVRLDAFSFRIPTRPQLSLAWKLGPMTWRQIPTSLRRRMFPRLRIPTRRRVILTASNDPTTQSTTLSLISGCFPISAISRPMTSSMT